MERCELTFRVFVSSTFSDLVAERNALQGHVFPRLREYCQKHGARFQAIDLRWGVSEEAALDQQTMNICLEELRRCQRTSPRPNFIVLLGQRYGWCPLPSQITATEFEPIRDQITAADDRALLDHWYRRDDNAVPPEYCLQPRQVEIGENQSEPDKETARDVEAREWRKTEHRLHTILLAGVNRLAWPLTDERRLKYEASATHQEILHGALKVADTIDHVFGFFRTLEGLPQDARARDYLDLDPQGQPDAEARARLDQLQADMRTRLPNNILTYSAAWTGAGPSADHLQQLCTDVYERLRKVIDEELQRRDRSDPVDQEAIAHQTFGQERARVFIGRQDLLQRIQQYLNSQDRHPLVVHGVSGSGKSALLAKAVAEVTKSESRNPSSETNPNDGNPQSAICNPQSELVVRYIGATPASSDIRSLLEGLCKEITLRYGDDASTVPMEYTKLVVEFPNRLALATAAKPLVVFLDALDQLSDADHGRNLAWLPARLPEHVRLVVSSLEVRRTADDCLGILRERLPAVLFLEVTPMTAQEGEEVLAVLLHEAHRTLQPQQRDEVLTKFRGCPYPLHLKLAFEEARRWKSWNRDVRVMGDVAGVLGNLFDRLELPQQHGALLVSRALGYLAASRHGLTEDELLDVLSPDKEVMADFRKRSPKSPKLDRLPVVVWARLFADIEPYMTQRQADGTTVLTFYHRQVGEAATTRYLPEQERRRVHDALATYFQNQADPDGNKSWKGGNPRPFAELPYHQACAGQSAAIESTLTDLGFIEVKCRLGMTHGLVNDYDRLGAGRTPVNPPIRTLWIYRGAAGIQCPYCLSWFLVEQIEYGIILLCSWCHSPLKLNKFAIDAEWHASPPRRKLTRITALNSYLVSTSLRQFGDFVNNQKHILSVCPDLTFQQAHNLPDGSPPNAAAKHRWSFGIENRPWLRWLNKPKQSDPRIATINGHRGCVHTCSYSPDGIQILSGGEDGVLELWDARNTSDHERLATYSAPISQCVYSPDGCQALVALDDGTLRLLDVSCKEEIRRFRGTPPLDWSPSGQQILAGTGDLRTVRLWNLDDGTMVDVLTTSSRGCWDCSYSPDGKYIVAGAGHPDCAQLTIWDAHDGSEIISLVRDYPNPIRVCRFSPDGLKIVFGSTGGTLEVWDIKAAVRLASLTGDMGYVTCCAYSPDGRQIVSGALGGDIRIWDAENYSELCSFMGNSGNVNAIDYSPDGLCIVSAFDTGSLMFWDTKYHSRSEIEARHGHQIQTVTLSRDGHRLTSESATPLAGLKLWEVANGSEIAEFRDLHDPVFSPDGQRIACVSSNYLGDNVSETRYEGSLEELDATTGARLRILTYLPRVFGGHPIDYSPNGRQVAALWDLKTVKIWNMHSLSDVVTINVDRVHKLQFSPNGRQLLTLSSNGLKLWNAETGVHIATIQGNPTPWSSAFAFSPDGRFIVSGLGNRSLKVWNSQTGSEILTLEGHSDDVMTCAYSPDGSYIVSGSRDGTIRFWDANSGREISQIARRFRALRDCFYSQDGRHILFGFDRTVIGMWDAHSGIELTRFIARDSICSIAASRDGKTIALGDDLGFVYFLQAEGLPLESVGKAFS